MSAVAPAHELVPAEQLLGFARRVFAASGMSEEDAAIAADAHLWADLHGADAQGAATKILQFVPRVRAGGTRADAPWKVVRERGSFALVDGNHGWGPVFATKAMRLAIEKAKRSGIGAVLVRDSSTACGMGYYPTLAIEQGQLGWAITNSQPLQAPFGGTTRVLGNQASAIGAPAGRNRPPIFDAATTAITTNEIERLRDAGEPLPPGVVLNERGEPPRDHEEALKGMLLPMAGHRGYGFAVMWEVFTGVLSGGAIATGVAKINDVAAKASTSFVMIAIDPQGSLPVDAFTARVDSIIDEVHATPKAPGVERVVVPGERGAELAERRKREGIPVPAARVAKLRALGEDVGIPW